MATISEDSQSCFNLGRMFFDAVGVNRDLTKSLEWFNQAADKGHIDANYVISCFYYYGYGVEKNNETAMEYAMKSIKQQHPKGHFIAGVCHYHMKDYNKAFQHFELSATSRYHKAEQMMAWCYYKGQGTIVNIGKAFIYAQRSALQGNIESKYMAGICSIVLRRYATAYDYLKEAANMGHIGARDEFNHLRDFITMKTIAEHPNKRRKINHE